MPTRLWFGRVGALAFWDAGHATDSLKELSIQHDVGVGLRGLVPQLQPFVFRLDFAFPLTGPEASFVPRISAGMTQAF